MKAERALQDDDSDNGVYVPASAVPVGSGDGKTFERSAGGTATEIGKGKDKAVAKTKGKIKNWNADKFKAMVAILPPGSEPPEGTPKTRKSYTLSKENFTSSISVLLANQAFYVLNVENPQRLKEDELLASWNLKINKQKGCQIPWDNSERPIALAFSLAQVVAGWVDGEGNPLPAQS